MEIVEADQVIDHLNRYKQHAAIHIDEIRRIQLRDVVDPGHVHRAHIIIDEVLVIQIERVVKQIVSRTLLSRPCLLHRLQIVLNLL